MSGAHWSGWGQRLKRRQPTTCLHVKEQCAVCVVALIPHDGMREATGQGSKCKCSKAAREPLGTFVKSFFDPGLTEDLKQEQSSGICHMEVLQGMSQVGKAGNEHMGEQ